MRNPGGCGNGHIGDIALPTRVSHWLNPGYASTHQTASTRARNALIAAISSHTTECGIGYVCHSTL